jgi:hypothetical protein
VPHARRAQDRLFRHKRGEIGDLADPSPDLEPGPTQDRKARRVIAAVLDPSESIEEDPAGFPGPYVADYPAHTPCSSRLRSMGNPLPKGSNRLLHIGLPARTPF